MIPGRGWSWHREARPPAWGRLRRGAFSPKMARIQALGQGVPPWGLPPPSPGLGAKGRDWGKEGVASGPSALQSGRRGPEPFPPQRHGSGAPPPLLHAPIPPASAPPPAPDPFRHPCSTRRSPRHPDHERQPPCSSGRKGLPRSPPRWMTTPPVPRWPPRPPGLSGGLRRVKDRNGRILTQRSLLLSREARQISLRMPRGPIGIWVCPENRAVSRSRSSGVRPYLGLTRFRGFSQPTTGPASVTSRRHPLPWRDGCHSAAGAAGPPFPAPGGWPEGAPRRRIQKTNPDAEPEVPPQTCRNGSLTGGPDAGPEVSPEMCRDGGLNGAPDAACEENHNCLTCGRFFQFGLEDSTGWPCKTRRSLCGRSS